MRQDYSEILDNKDFTVKSRANELANGAETVKIAVGYFFIGGFELLAEDLEDVDTVQILIGHETNSETIEQLKQVLSDDIEEFNSDKARE
ncbi:MAG: helicase Snf3, partial [Halobacteriaceae archaeon]